MVSLDGGWQPRLTPNPTGFAAAFYAWCAREELRFQRCSSCGVWRHPPRVLCGACGAAGFSWERSTGRGRLFTWTVTHQALLPAFAPDTPYVVAVVELDEGVRLVSGLRGVAPADLALDLPLEVDFAKLSEEIGLHFFRPCGAP